MTSVVCGSKIHFERFLSLEKDKSEYNCIIYDGKLQKYQLEMINFENLIFLVQCYTGLYSYNIFDQDSGLYKEFYSHISTNSKFKIIFINFDDGGIIFNSEQVESIENSINYRMKNNYGFKGENYKIKFIEKKPYLKKLLTISFLIIFIIVCIYLFFYVFNQESRNVEWNLFEKKFGMNKFTKCLQNPKHKEPILKCIHHLKKLKDFETSFECKK